MTAVESAYVTGFMAKCPEHGVDPLALVKSAYRGQQAIKLFSRLPESSLFSEIGKLGKDPKLGQGVFAAMAPRGTQNAAELAADVRKLKATMSGSAV